MWCIWKERNSRCFEDIERAMLDLKLLFHPKLLFLFVVKVLLKYYSTCPLMTFLLHAFFVCTFPTV